MKGDLDDGLLPKNVFNVITWVDQDQAQAPTTALTCGPTNSSESRHSIRDNRGARTDQLTRNDIRLITWVLEGMTDEDVAPEANPEADVADDSEVVDDLVHLKDKT